MPTYYANINNDYSDNGDGTLATPFNIVQLELFVEGSVVESKSCADGDIIKITGTKSDTWSRTTFKDCRFTITATSYDDGAPWVMSTNFFSSPIRFRAAVLDGKTLTIENAVISAPNIEVPTPAGTYGLTFKNCGFINGCQVISNNSSAGNLNIKYFGCTFNLIGFTTSDSLLTTSVNTAIFQDCTFHGGAAIAIAGWGGAGGPKAWGTATLLNCYFNVDISDALEFSIGSTYSGESTCNFLYTYTKDYLEPIFETGVPDFEQDDLSYYDFGLPIRDTLSRWNTDDYDDGFYGDARTGFGAFYFGGAVLVEQSLRLAVEPTQGYGWSEIVGDDWAVPLDNWGIMQYVDENGAIRNLIADKNDGFLWEEGTYDRTAYSRLSGRDKETGTTGTEIATEFHGAGINHSGATEDYPQEHFESHYFVEPMYPNDKGKTGYDSNGFRTEQQFDLDAYGDGNIETISASTDDIPVNGDIVFSGTKLEKKQMQFVFKSAAGEFVLKSNRHDFLAKPKAGNRTERTVSEMTNQAVLALPSYWIVRNGRYGPLRDILNRITLTASGTEVTGADGRVSSAFSLTSPFQLANEAIAGDFTFLLFGFAAAIATAQSPLASFGEEFGGGWNLWYWQGTGLNANQLLSNCIFEDIRIYNSQLSSAALRDLYNDMRYNEGKGLLPLF
jgi:hypothetical protein